MKSLFNLDGPLARTLSVITDLVLINFLFILFSLPIVTIGASITAMSCLCQKILKGEEVRAVQDFTGSFKSNFRPATIILLFSSIILSGLYAYYFLAGTMLTGPVLGIVKGVIAFIFLFVTASAAVCFQLMARYENSISEYIKNSFLIILLKLPRAIIIIFLLAVPVFITLINIYTLGFGILVWILLGFSGITYLISKILNKVFLQLEENFTDNDESHS